MGRSQRGNAATPINRAIHTRGEGAVVILVLCAAVVAWGVCLLAVRYATEHALRYDHDKPQRFHLGHTPRLGGLGVVVGWVTGVWVVGVQLGYAQDARVDLRALPPGWLLVAICPLVGAGLLEDFTQKLSAWVRLACSAVAAVFIMLLLDIRVDRLDISVIDTAWHGVAWVWWTITLAALVGLPHAFNIIDGYNGLAGTVTVLICLAIAHVALQVGDRELATLVLCLVGATVGFLLWNYPKGLIFAGDGGAYFWGVMVAITSIALVQRHRDVSPWFPMLLLIYPVWETMFSIYRKLARGGSPGVADALHFHQLIFRRIVREVFHDDEARRMLMRNNRTSPYLWGFTLLTVVPAVLFWNNTPVLMGFCLLFVCTYVPAYLMIVRFKVPRWIRRGRGR